MYTVIISIIHAFHYKYIYILVYGATSFAYLLEENRIRFFP